MAIVITILHTHNSDHARRKSCKGKPICRNFQNLYIITKFMQDKNIFKIMQGQNNLQWFLESSYNHKLHADYEFQVTIVIKFMPTKN